MENTLGHYVGYRVLSLQDAVLPFSSNKGPLPCLQHSHPSSLLLVSSCSDPPCLTAAEEEEEAVESIKCNEGVNKFRLNLVCELMAK